MKKEIKKFALIISIFVISLVGFSSAVYGRFFRQYNPEVSSFGITIASQENILVSSSGVAGTFKDSVKLEDLVSNTSVNLTPLTGKVSTTTDGEYKNLTLSDDSGNVASPTKYLSFDLFFIGSEDMNLYLKGNTYGIVTMIFDDSNANYHFTDQERERLHSNLRIGFLTYSTTYQPSGVGTSVTYSSLPTSANIYATEVITTDNYTTFKKLGYSNTSDDTIIASTKKNEVTKVKVVIWLEDDNIDDLAAICDLTLSIRFEAIIAND